MRIIGITQARTGSTRFPNKVLKKIKGKTLLDIHLDRLGKCKKLDHFIVATTTENEDEQIVQVAKDNNTDYYRGSEEDVLDRFYQSLKGKSCDYVVRITSDCPLIDPELVDEVIKFTIDKNLDYGSNTLEPTFPDGQDIEVFKYEVLKEAWKNASSQKDREHVTPFILRNSKFKGGQLYLSDNFYSDENYANVRMTVDKKEDFEVIKKLIYKLGIEKNWLDYTNYLLSHEELSSINDFKRNEGF